MNGPQIETLIVALFLVGIVVYLLVGLARYLWTHRESSRPVPQYPRPAVRNIQPISQSERVRSGR